MCVDILFFNPYRSNTETSRERLAKQRVRGVYDHSAFLSLIVPEVITGLMGLLMNVCMCV
jgi:hypothetical protein